MSTLEFNDGNVTPDLESCAIKAVKGLQSFYADSVTAAGYDLTEFGFSAEIQLVDDTIIRVVGGNDRWDVTGFLPHARSIMEDSADVSMVRIHLETILGKPGVIEATHSPDDPLA